MRTCFPCRRPPWLHGLPRMRAARQPHRRVPVNLNKLLRILAFIGGAIGAVVEAIELAQKSDAQVTPTHLYAAGFLAVVMFALKWPGDLTAREAKELEA